MKIAIIGATGNAGSFILKEALSRKADVTAIVRSPEKLTVEVPYLKKDLFELTQEDLTDFDIVVDAFGAPQGKEELHQTSIDHLVTLLKGSATRLFVVGGTSSLYINDEKTERMIDEFDPNSPMYPTAYNMYQSLVDLKEAKDVNWTYLSPAAYFNPNGRRTGSYKLGGDRMLVNAAGKSEISMADYAIAMLEVIESGKHNKEHISVIGE